MVRVELKGPSRWSRSLLRKLLLHVLAVVVTPAQIALAGDPWAFWGRTPSRIARTDTIGPQTPTIEWSVQVSPHSEFLILDASPVMDAQGTVFVGHPRGITGVDTIARQVLWDFRDGEITRGLALSGGRVFWGDFAPRSTLYCFDAASGDEIWRFRAGDSISSAPVVGTDGVLYIDVGSVRKVYALRVEDGSEVWTSDLNDSSYCSPSLDAPQNLVTGDGFSIVSLNPDDGGREWTSWVGREAFGVAPIYAERVYVGSTDSSLYCFDAATGRELWTFWCGYLNDGAVAIGADGTIYTATTGGLGILFAISPNGEELWRYIAPGLISNAPIVAGDGVIYFCSTHWTGQLYEGWVHAIRPDGSVLWAKQMPDAVRASPMLAPDGTLYVVCRDKFLYAIREPYIPGDINGDDNVDLIDFMYFQRCFSGPVQQFPWAPPSPGCQAAFDFDDDTDVDPLDYDAFLDAVTGP